MITEIKRMEDWMLISEAAEELGYSKTGLHRLIFHSPNSPFNVDTDLRALGSDTRPTFLIRTAAVQAVKEHNLRPAEEVANGEAKIHLMSRRQPE